MVQSPTTPCQFDMWKDADVLRLDVPPTPHAHPYSGKRGVLHHIMFVFVTQICLKCKNKLQTDVLLLFSLYSLWRFTCIEDSYKRYSH